MENTLYQQVVGKLEPAARLRRYWSLTGGVSTNMTALEIDRPNGQTAKVIVRRPGEWAVGHNRNAAEDEFKLLQTLHINGIAVPKPRLLDQSGDVFAEPYLVVDYIEGEPEFDPMDAGEFVLQLATRLGHIHHLDVSRLGLSFLPAQQRRLSADFAKQPDKIDHSLDEARIRAVLEVAWPFADMNASVLLHGDYWPGNPIWRDGRIAAVIDWEDAELGDPLFDLAITRLELLWLLGVEAMDGFTLHYQSTTAANAGNLPYWDLCAAIRPVNVIATWAEAWRAQGKPQITEETMRRDHTMFVDQAMEKLGKR